MTLNKEYANIYLVSSLISAFVIFYGITLVSVYNDISSGSRSLSKNTLIQLAFQSMQK